MDICNQVFTFSIINLAAVNTLLHISLCTWTGYIFVMYFSFYY